MDSITIKKASLSSGMGLNVIYTQKEKDGTITEITRSCSSPVHEDMTKQFDKLNIYLGVISEFIPHDDIENIENPKHDLLETFKVKEFEIVDSDSGVKISGSHRLSTGKKLSLKTPAIKWNDKKPYWFSSDLATVIEGCKHEIIQYLFHGKRAPELQQEFEFGEDNPTPDAVADE